MFSKQALRKAISNLRKVHPDKLWRQVHNIALSFALHGETDPALRMWQVLYDRGVSDKTPTASGDNAITAVCWSTGHPDFSRGIPKPAGVNKANSMSLVDRLNAHEKLNLEQWLANHYAFESVNAPNEGLANYLRGQEAARDGRYQEAISTLQDAIDSGASIPVYSASTALIAISWMAHQVGDEARANSALKSWYELAQKYPYNVTAEDVFAVKHAAEAACNGLFKPFLELSPAECAEAFQSVSDAINAVVERKTASAKRYLIHVQYNQFSLEPLKPDHDWVPFENSEDSDRGYSMRHRHAAIATPGETGQCEVELEFARQLPDVETCVQAVSVPLSVGSKRVYLRDVVSPDDTMPFDVPPGNYDVVARFFPAKSKSKVGLRKWRVVLTFLPAGTVGPKTFKLEQ